MELVDASKMRNAFQNMFNLYAHELSAYNAWIGTQIDFDGNFLKDAVNDYLNENNYKAYCIIENNNPIGMVVFESDENIHTVEEIFLVKTSRHEGIAEKICKDFWNNNKGTGELSVLPDNKGAINFWNKLLNMTGFKYTTSNENGMVEYHFPLY